MKQLLAARKLEIGDKVGVLARPELGECTVVEKIKLVRVLGYHCTFYRLNWKDKWKYDVDVFMLSELGEW